MKQCNRSDDGCVSWHCSTRVLPVTSPGSAAGEMFAAQPRALIVTVYGLYARDSGGWFGIAALIRLMAELGIEGPAVRSAMSRLKSRGLVESRRDGGAVGYGVTSRGAKFLAEGDRRIFDRPRVVVPDGWLLVVFSVPEQERSRRHALRSRLTWLGFGTVSAGAWIAPAHLAAETRDVLAADGMAGYVSLFTADYLAFGDLREKVGQWWDLGRLERLYQAFIDSASPILARWQAAGPRAVAAPTAAGPDPADRSGRAFADYVRVLTVWRRLPFLDPGLPAELMPESWAGARAGRLFGELRGLLAGPAAEHVRAIRQAVG